MNRRNFLILTSVAAAFAVTGAHAAGQAYSAEAVAADLKAGRIVLLDFTASWCPSCQAQGRRLEALRGENPAYDGAIAFYDVDWDTYKRTELTKRFGIRSRGAIVILKGDAVLAQTYSHSSKEDLKTLLDAALASA